MTSDAAAWFLFAGAVFCLMGLRLCADAEGDARSVRAWLPATDLRRLIRAYQAGGAVFLAVGLCALAGVRLFPEALARALPQQHLAGGMRKAAGLLCAFAGLGMILHKAFEWARPGALPRALERELGLELGGPALGERLAGWCGWALAGAFLVFGCYLLR